MVLLDRFYNKLPDTLNEYHCWEWKGAIDRHGYGAFSIGKRVVKAHRVSYEIFYAEPLNNLHCLHKCDNRKCVNPHHLFAGSHLDNMIDKVQKNRCYSGDQKGGNNGASKITDDQAKEIRKLYNLGKYTKTKLAKMYNVHRTNIYYIVTNKTFKHLLED
jgi:hypothetical protein